MKPIPRPISEGRHARAALALALAAVAGCSDGPTIGPPEGAVDLAAPWFSASPESVGLDGPELFVAGELAGRIERMRSLLVVRNGRLVLERYYGGWSADTLADVRSVTKSVVSTLAGIALREGHIRSLDQPITDFLRVPEYDVDAEHTRVRIRHLLTMTAGFAWSERTTEAYNDWVLSSDHVAYVLERPVASPPGTAFAYNSGAVHLLGVILEEATGTSLPQYADRVLLGPLGISERAWEPLLEGHVNGGAGLDLRPRDLARLGQLFLQQGWSGTRSIVPAEWVAEATEPRFADLGGVGPIGTLSYGYLWWIDVENDAFMARGHGGQLVYVVPSLHLVVVATTEWRGASQDVGAERLTEEVLKVIVERVLPAAR